MDRGIGCFSGKHGDCLALDGKDAAKALEKAFDLCRWMGEESDYLQTVYQRRADEKELNCLTGWIVFL